MTEVQQIVKNVARIWRMHKSCESLFKRVMGMEISPRLRKICCTGLMISALCKKELCTIYDKIKCSLEDGDLESINVNDDYSAYTDADYMALISILISKQASAIEKYQDMLSEFSEDNALLLREHLSVLLGLNNALQKEVKKVLDKSQKATYVAVA